MEQAITMGLDPVITMAVQVITMPWNERSRWSGLADHDAVESVATIAWRAQPSLVLVGSSRSLSERAEKGGCRSISIVIQTVH
ncbi:MAG TPA: hypothetical protein VI299_29255, partial [Polyangiales bacterium]